MNEEYPEVDPRRIEWSGPGEAPTYTDLLDISQGVSNLETLRLLCIYSYPTCNDGRLPLLIFPKLKTLSLGLIPEPSNTHPDNPTQHITTPRMPVSPPSPRYGPSETTAFVVEPSSPTTEAPLHIRADTNQFTPKQEEHAKFAQLLNGIEDSTGTAAY
jgi:hypothetical protein